MENHVWVSAECIGVEVVMSVDKRRLTCEGLIACIKPWKSFIEPDEDFADVGDLSFGVNPSKGVFEYWQPMSLHILSTELPVDGDWVYVPKYPEALWQFKTSPCPMPYWGNDKECKKVIATTDGDYKVYTKGQFRYGVLSSLPKLERSFIELFIKTYKDEDSRIDKVFVDYDKYRDEKGDEKLVLKVDGYNKITIRLPRENLRNCLMNIGYNCNNSWKLA
jgi:hypothetical protein